MSETRLKPKAAAKGKPVFDEPWQAQVLAMADLLIQSGQIGASEWSKSLGQQLALKQIGDGDTQENYYKAALCALTEIIQANEMISSRQLALRESDWKNAYLSTPHGQPVTLSHDRKQD